MSAEAQLLPPLRELFSQALEIEGEAARRAFLDQACGGNRQLRSEVDGLLAAHLEQRSGLLDNLAPCARDTVLLADAEQTTTDAPGGLPQIERFELREQIGEGGMGIVYVAEQTEPIRRKVALKVIKPGMDSKEVIARFEAERQVLALMDHSNIAKVIDAGATGTGRPYFVMELVRGLPITEYCDQAKLSLRERLKLFITVCQAVQHAHQKGIIHRDLKPSNVMITLHDGKPVPKVIDFGVAKALNQRLTEHSLYTRHAQILGTPLYMSPEQAELSGLDVDVRSDVYALGVLLYELLTGQTPFDRDALRMLGYDELRRMVIEVEPPRPSARVSTLLGENRSTVATRRGIDERHHSRTLKGELDWIVMQALEKDRSRRYQSASALAADVRCFLDDRPVAARPPSTLYRFGKFARRHRMAFSALVVIAVTFLCGLVGTAWQAVEANQQRRVAEEQKRDAQEQREVAILERNSAVLQRQLALSNRYSAEIVSGQTDWERGNIGSLHRKLVGHLPVQAEEDRRGWEWYYLLSQCHPEERTLFRRFLSPFAAWSPDGEYVAIAGVIWNARSGECVRMFSTSYIARNDVAWSPDGQRFAWGLVDDDNGIYIWDRLTDQVRSLRGHEKSVWCLAWSPDGTQIASGSQDKTVKIWDIAQGRTVRTISTGTYVTDVAWSPHDDLLAASVKGGGIKVWTSSTAELVFDGEMPGSIGVNISWNPDGGQLAVCDDDRWFLLSRSDWSVIREQDHATGEGHDIAWNMDGTRLAVAQGEVVTIWDPAGEQPLATLRGHLRPVNSVAWSPDGAQLVTSDEVEEIKIWDWDAPLQPAPISTDGTLESLAWLGDGRTLVTVSADNSSVSSWDVAAGHQINVERPQAEGPVLWSPDRRLWAVRAGTYEEPEVRILEASTGTVHSVWQAKAQHRLHAIAWSPDATKLAIETSFEGDADVEFWDVDHEQTISHWRRQQHHYRNTLRQMWWSDDGTRVAIKAHGDVSDDGSVSSKLHAHVVDVATGNRLLKHKLGGFRHQGDVTALAWNSDGDRLACGGSEGGIEVLDTDSGRVLAGSKPHNARIDALAWSPDGRRLATASRDGSVKLLTVTDAAELLTFTFAEDPPRHLAWSADGQRLAAATHSGVIQVWDAERGYRFREQGSRQGELAWAYYGRKAPGESGVDRLARQEFLRLAPDTLGYWEPRGHARATLGEFEQAAQEFAKAIGTDAQLAFDPARFRALALLGAGHLAAYRDACAALVEDFRDSAVPSNRKNVAWLCALSPNPPADTDNVLRMARDLHSHESTFDEKDDQALITGVSLFRDGQYAEAVTTLTALSSKLGRGGDTTDRYELACAQYVIALARHRQEQDFQARRHLDEARRHADAYRAIEQDWTALVALSALQREAEAALGEP